MPKNSRKDYQKILKEIKKRGKCPFCFLEFHREPILKRYFELRNTINN